MQPLRYTFLPKQLEMAHVPHREDLDCCLYVGGFGSGKTHGGVLLGLLLSYLYPRSRGLVGAAEYTLLRDTTRMKYEELMPAGWVKSWRRRPDNLLLANGSEIWFRALGEAERLKSKEFNWIHIEEASQVSFDTFRMLVGRLRHNGNTRHPDFPELERHARRKRMFLTTNPEETPGWLHRVFEDPEYRRENGLGGNYRRVHAPTDENAFLLDAQPGYLERMLEVYDEDYAQVYVYGHTGNLGGRRVYHAFDRTRNVRADIRPAPSLPLRLCCDFNVEPMVWVIAQIRPDGEVWVLDEVVIDRDALTDSACRIYREKYGGWPAGLNVYADASGGARTTTVATSNHAIIKRELGDQPGFRWCVPRRNPPVRDRIVTVNGLLCNSRGERRLIVHPQCRHLVRDFLDVQRPRGRAGDCEKIGDVTDPRHLLTHASDAVGYMLCREFPIAQPSRTRSARIRL